MLTPPFKLSNRLSIDHKVKICSDPPTETRAKFSPSLIWGFKHESYLDEFVTIKEIDDLDATFSIRESNPLWFCYSWIYPDLSKNTEQILQQIEGQRQLDFAKKRSDFHMSVSFGWIPPMEQWENGDIVIVHPKNQASLIPSQLKAIGKEGKIIKTRGKFIEIELDAFLSERNENYFVVFRHEDLKWHKRPHW